MYYDVHINGMGPSGKDGLGEKKSFKWQYGFFF